VVGSDVVDEILDSGGDEAGGDEELFNVRTVLCPNVVEHHEHDTRDEMSRNMLLPDTMLPPSMLLARSDMDDIVEEQVAYESKESEPSAADAAPRINRTLTMNAAAPRSANNAPGPFPFEDLTNTEAMVCQEELDVDIDESEDEEETRAVNIKPPNAVAAAAADPTLPLEFTSMMAADSDEEVGEDIAPDEVDLTGAAAIFISPHAMSISPRQATQPLLPPPKQRKLSRDDQMASQCNSSIGGDSEAYEEDFDALED